MQPQQEESPKVPEEWSSQSVNLGQDEQDEQDEREARHKGPGPSVDSHNGADRELNWGSGGDVREDSDLLLNLPQLTVDELDLELETSFGLDRIKINAKSLEAGLLVKASLGNIAAVVRPGVERAPEIVEGVATELPRSLSAGSDDGEAEDTEDGEGGQVQAQEQGSAQAAPEQDADTGRHPDEVARDELLAAYQSARAAFERISGEGLQQEVREAYESARTAYERIFGQSAERQVAADERRDDRDQRDTEGDDMGKDNEESSTSVPRRGQEVVKGMGKAAPAAALGAAGASLGAAGALLVAARMLPRRRRALARVVGALPRHSRTGALAKQVRKAML